MNREFKWTTFDSVVVLGIIFLYAVVTLIKGINEFEDSGRMIPAGDINGSMFLKDNK